MKATNYPSDKMTIKNNNGDLLLEIDVDGIESIIFKDGSRYNGAEIDAAIGKANTIPAVTSADYGRVLGVDEDGEIVTVENESTTVVANPTLAGTEAALTGLQVGTTKYRVDAEEPLVVLATFHYFAQPIDDDDFEIIANVPAIDVKNAMDTGKPVVMQAKVVSDISGSAKTSDIFLCIPDSRHDSNMYSWRLAYSEYCPTNAYPLRSAKMPTSISVAWTNDNDAHYTGRLYEDWPGWVQLPMMYDTNQRQGSALMYDSFDDAVQFDSIYYIDNWETSMTSIFDSLLTAATSAGHAEASMQITDPDQVAGVEESLHDYTYAIFNGQPCAIQFTSYVLSGEILLTLTSGVFQSDGYYSATFEGEVDAITDSQGSLTSWTGYKVSFKLTMRGEPNDGGFVAAAMSITKKDYPLLSA